MQKKIVIITLIVSIALGGWLGHYFSAEEVIKRQLVSLALELGKEGQETPVQMALKLGKVKNMLAERCQVSIPERSYSESLERDLIIQYLIYHRSRYDSITVAFEDVVVAIPAKDQAEVQATVRLYRQQTRQQEDAPEVQQVELGLHKGENWLLQQVMMPEALVR
ncbi:MAG: hypothetical protein KKD73_02715 [Proteobacteria bacterium]|nr:hypothetical protein [Pseudomonadota bacterium]MBU1640505.1 hypothetical protein [Pseudomonadota bacterium]